MRKGESIFKRKDGRYEGRYIKGYNGDVAIYGYVYIEVSNSSSYGGKGGNLLLKVGGASFYAGIRVPIYNSNRQYAPEYKATTSGITVVQYLGGDGVATNVITGIWGVAGLT